MIGAAAGSLCIISLVGIASAATNTQPASLASELAAKFHLKQTDVQSVIDSHKTEEHAFREQAVKDRIAQAIKDGKITQAQADALTAKLAELKPATKPADGAKPTDAQRAAMKAKRDAFRQWLTDNNIPQDLVGHGGHGGFGHRGGMTPPAGE